MIGHSSWGWHAGLPCWVIQTLVTPLAPSMPIYLGFSHISHTCSFHILGGGILPLSKRLGCTPNPQSWFCSLEQAIRVISSRDWSLVHIQGPSSLYWHALCSSEPRFWGRPPLFTTLCLWTLVHPICIMYTPLLWSGLADLGLWWSKWIFQISAYGFLYGNPSPFTASFVFACLYLCVSLCSWSTEVEHT